MTQDRGNSRNVWTRVRGGAREGEESVWGGEGEGRENVHSDATVSGGPDGRVRGECVRSAVAAVVEQCHRSVQPVIRPG